MYNGPSLSYLEICHVKIIQLSTPILYLKPPLYIMM
jgi:hypothetical protein